MIVRSFLRYCDRATMQGGAAAAAAMIDAMADRLIHGVWPPR